MLPNNVSHTARAELDPKRGQHLLASDGQAPNNDKMSAKHANHLGYLSAAVVLAWLAASGVGSTGQAAEEAPPPNWPREVQETFFDDAREELEGERPDYKQLDAESARPAANDPETAAAAEFAWSHLIDSATIETEIKRLTASVAQAASAPGAFKSSGYKSCRRDFSELAVLFGVVGQYDGSVRWQDVAPGLRDQFARAGRNSKVGTDQTYQQAAARKQELEELVRGTRPQVPPGERAVVWGEMAELAPLMQRMNQAELERLQPWLADERQFARHRGDVRHEAQLVAMIAEVIGRDGFDYWDEAEYAAHARALKQAAGELATAAAADDFQRAQAAGVRITKACADCHADYRG